MNENDIGQMVIDCAVKLHKALGPGLLESVYEKLLTRCLERRGLSVQRQVPVAFEFEGEQFDEGFRADMIVNEKVIIELKSVEKAHPAHKKQLLTYLKLTGLKLGLSVEFWRSSHEGWDNPLHKRRIINFSVPLCLCEKNSCKKGCLRGCL